jgi:hypothetical protein
MSRYSQFRFSPLHHEHGFCSSHFCFLARQLLHAYGIRQTKTNAMNIPAELGQTSGAAVLT